MPRSRCSDSALRTVLFAGLWPACCSAIAGPEDHRQIKPQVLAEQLPSVLTDPAQADAAYWRKKPVLAAPFGLVFYWPTLPNGDAETVARFKAGEFQAHPYFPWKPLGVPPDWRDNPFGNRSFDLWRHSLRWTEPLVNQWIIQDDAESLSLMKRILADWIRNNSSPDQAPGLAWYDHAVSERLRVFCWFWELWRKTPDFDWDFARILLASIYQHMVYQADEKHYLPRSNHGLLTDESLLAAAITFPEFQSSAGWLALADKRLARFAETNFDAQGFNLEQSPSCHWFVVRELSEIAAFLRANQHPVPPVVSQVVKRAISVWPHLIRPDGSLPSAGDSVARLKQDWRQTMRDSWGSEIPPPAPSTVPGPRPDAGTFLLSFEVGYAIFTSYRMGEPGPDSDTHVLFRCNSWSYSPHCHKDALSFELFALGREWLVDSGVFHYEYTPERAYMRSARAHNVVLLDNRDFKFHPIRLVDFGRTPDGDFVVARHELPQATHTRRFEFLPPRLIRLTDELQSSDARPHRYTQLFHVAPGLEVEIVSPEMVRLSASDGSVCTIEQAGDGGEWSVITGQKQPYVQGWYSRQYNELEPSPALYYTTPERLLSWKTVTTISLRPR
jgi:hypothetical protein